jgi:hypothetical protein
MRRCGKVLLIVPVEIRPEDGLEKVETCRPIDYVVVLCVTALSRHTKVKVKYSSPQNSPRSPRRGVQR